MKFLICIFIYILSFNAVVYAQEQDDGLDFLPEFPLVEGLPQIYFEGNIHLGRYRESVYSQKFFGFGIVVGLPIDFALSAECYADFSFHMPGESASTFWKDYFSLAQSYTLMLTGFRILSGGGRFKFDFYRGISVTLGGGLGFFGFTPSIVASTGTTAFQRQSAILYEVEIGLGYKYLLSKKYYLTTGGSFKFYYVEDIVNHQMAIMIDIIGIGYNYL